jgi:hypothetical protein
MGTSDFGGIASSDLSFGEGAFLLLAFCVGALDHAPVSLRPINEYGLENDAAFGVGEFGGDGYFAFDDQVKE